MNKEVTVIIPTWKPGRELTQLLLRLKRQSVPPERILIINTDEKYFRVVGVLVILTGVVIGVSGDEQSDS